MSAEIPAPCSLLVTGSRSIKTKAVVEAFLDKFIQHTPVRLLIHGGAPGVDTLAGQWAKSRGIPVKVVRPDFKTYPVNRFKWKAYTVRDYAMVDMADKVVAIWDGHSGGTRKTFEYAELKQKLLTIHKV